ncbi:MAG: hypothetical protein QXV32_03080 [Conexivisphaerales archaeon]
MPPPADRFRFYTNMLVSTLLSLILLVVVLHFGGYLKGIEGGVYMGFSTALLAWVAFFLALAADMGMVLLLILRSQSSTLSLLYRRHRILSIALPLSFLAAIAVLQFGTPYLGYIEAGVSQGIAPPILLSLAPALSILAVIALMLFTWKFRYLQKVSVPEKAKVEVVQNTFPQVREQTGPTDIPTAPSAIHSSEGKKSIAKEQLELISSILDNQEMQKLVDSELIVDSAQDRDQLQTRKNIEQWILESVRASGRITKNRLEADFERQFPPVYLALFNSVLYDLVYKDKLVISREGSRTIIALPSKN